MSASPPAAPYSDPETAQARTQQLIASLEAAGQHADRVYVQLAESKRELLRLSEEAKRTLGKCWRQKKTFVCSDLSQDRIHLVALALARADASLNVLMPPAVAKEQ